MPDFLGRLAARSLGVAPVAQPVVPAMFAPGGVRERLEPAQDAGPGITAERMGTMQSPNTAPEAAIEEAPATAARASDPGSARTAPAAKPAGVLVEASASAATPEVVRSNSLEISPAPPTRIERMLAITHGQSHQGTIAADSALVAPGNGRPPAADAQLAIPTTVTRTGRESQADSLPVESSATTRSRMPPTPSPAAPVIRVSIGRVEVRAEFPASPALRSGPKQAQPPALSIEEYSRQRSEGKR